MSSQVKVTDQGQGHFAEGSRSFGKVSYSVAGSENEIPPLMTYR